MSNERSPRAVCSTTIGTSGMGPPSLVLRCNRWLRTTVADPQPLRLRHSDSTRRHAMTDRIERELWLPAAPDDGVGGGHRPMAGWRRRGRARPAARRRRAVSTPATRSGRLGRGRPRARGALDCFWWARDDEPATRVELTLDEPPSAGTRLRVVETRPLEMLDLVGDPASAAPAARPTDPRSWRRECDGAGIDASGPTTIAPARCSARSPTRRGERCSRAIAEHPAPPRPSSPRSCRSRARRCSST